MSEKVKIILPPVASSQIDLDLVRLTEAIADIDPDLAAHGVLGGEWGYGAAFENDEFMMHPFCWCDENGCNWCSDDAPNFLHKPSGIKIRWYKWIGRGMSIEPETIESAQWQEIIEACIASLRRQR